MSKNLKNCSQKLAFIASIKNTNFQKKLLKTLPYVCYYKALNEIAKNALNEDSLLYSHMKKVFPKIKNPRSRKKFARLLKQLSKTNHNKSIKKNLVVQTGGFLQYLIPTVLSILPSIFK